MLKIMLYILSWQLFHPTFTFRTVFLTFYHHSDFMNSSTENSTLFTPDNEERCWLLFQGCEREREAADETHSARLATL